MRLGIRSESANAKPWVSTFLLVAAWLYANTSSLAWLFESFKYASRFNLILAGCVVVAALVYLARTRPLLVVSATPQLRWFPVLLMLASAFGELALRWFVDIPQLNVLLFVLGTYGLGGLFLAPHLWHKNLPVAALVACILPFSAQVGSGLGFPLRVLTAQAVEQMLANWHISAISSVDIIVLENGIAHVDLPCSGLKSLWTGTLFLLAATGLEGRQLGLRWLGVWGFHLLLLVWANTLRVILLVLLTHVWQQPQLAEIVHIPLGLIGFIGACALAWVLLQKVPKYCVKKHGDGEETLGVTPLNSKRQNHQLAGLVMVVIAIAVVAQVKPPQDNLRAIATLQWPAQIVSEPLPLTAAEQRFFDNPANPIPEKRRFVMGEVSGSILTVISTSWHAHHPPELCLLGNGLKVDQMERKQLTPEIMARWLSLQNGQLTATYWFQSSQRTTDDFVSRIWDYVIHQNKTWVLVSILFDNSRNPDSSEIQDFTTTIYEAIQQSLQGS